MKIIQLWTLILSFCSACYPIKTFCVRLVNCCRTHYTNVLASLSNNQIFPIKWRILLTFLTLSSGHHFLYRNQRATTEHRCTTIYHTLTSKIRSNLRWNYKRRETSRFWIYWLFDKTVARWNVKPIKKPTHTGCQLSGYSNYYSK